MQMQNILNSYPIFFANGRKVSLCAVGTVVDIIVANGDREGSDSDCTQEYGIKEVKQSPMYSILPSVTRARAFEW